MLRYIMIRLVLVVLQVFLVATVVFSLLHLLPGDPVLIVLGSESNPSPEVVASVRARLGLDQPLHIQYTRWLQDIVRLDFGESMVNNQPVWDELSKRIPRTFELVLAAIFIAILFGIPLGIWFRGELKAYWEDVCLSPAALARGYFRPEALRRLWDEHQGGRRDHGYKLWALLMLELWHRQYAPDARAA